MTAAAESSSVPGASKPLCCRLEMPSIMASVAPVSSSTPIQSKLRRVISRGSGSQRAASHRAATPVGTPSPKMADQENMSSNMPPRPA